MTTIRWTTPELGIQRLVITATQVTAKQNLALVDSNPDNLRIGSIV